MEKRNDFKVGDFGLVKIKGPVGAFVRLGQWFVGDFSPWTHAFVYVGHNQVVEAMPQGALLTPLSDYKDREILWSHIPLTHNQRRAISFHARKLVGTPYSFFDYFSLFAERIGWDTDTFREYVADSGHMICSQLVDEVYKRAGVHLFNDGRLPQDVTPGDLEIMLRSYPR